MSFRSRRAAGERPLLDLLRSAIDSAGGKEVVGKALGGLLLDAFLVEEEPERQDVEGDTTYTPINESEFHPMHNPTLDVTLEDLCRFLSSLTKSTGTAINLSIQVTEYAKEEDGE